jgi:hypothetical protein
MGLGSGIPDPRVKKAPDPGSGSAVLPFMLSRFESFLLNLNPDLGLYYILFFFS